MDEHGSAQERFSHGSWRRGAAGPAGISGVQQQPYYGRPLRQQGGAGGFQSMAREAFLEKRVAAAEAAAERAREELLGACAREQAARGDVARARALEAQLRVRCAYSFCMCRAQPGTTGKRQECITMDTGIAFGWLGTC